MNRESLEQLVERDPGDSAFGELADLLLDQGEVDRALRVCLAGLSANPGFHQGRLTLAKIFQSAGYLPFAIRELEQLERALPETNSISKLLERLAPDLSLIHI